MNIEFASLVLKWRRGYDNLKELESSLIETVIEAGETYVIEGVAEITYTPPGITYCVQKAFHHPARASIKAL